jgi:hypothetical protein
MRPKAKLAVGNLPAYSGASGVVTRVKMGDKF